MLKFGHNSIQIGYSRYKERILINIIGKRIRKLRQEKGLTQEELGEILGVKKAAVQKYETNKETNLKASKIRELCKTFHVHPWVFIYEDYDMVLREMFEKDPGNYRRPTAEDLNGRVLKEIKKTHGQDSMMISAACLRLNKKGKIRVLTYIDDLLKIDEYQSHYKQSD